MQFMTVLKHETLISIYGKPVNQSIYRVSISNDAKTITKTTVAWHVVLLKICEICHMTNINKKQQF